MMELHGYLDSMKEIQNVLLEYLDSEDNQEKYKQLINTLKNKDVLKNKHMLTSVIHLVSSIVDFHYRTKDFFDKIFNIILFLKDEIMKNYSNFEIYDFFKINKKVLLFLLQQKILIIDQLITSKIFQKDSSLGIEFYLYPEIKDYINDNYNFFSDDSPEEMNIEELRKNEYSDQYVLQLIQNDLLDKFIEYVNKNEFNIDEEIQTKPYFETNLFILFNKSPKPIEYAAFFGSVNIFKYLVANNCSLEQTVWLYAIHGRQPEIIHVLEENKIIPTDETCEYILSFSIECHHNELTKYILEHYIKDDKKTFIFDTSLVNYNFQLIDEEMIKSDNLYKLCDNDYFILANAVLSNDPNIDINSRIVIDGFDKIEGKPKKNEKTLLYIASLKGNLEIVQLLLEQKAIDVNKKSFKTSCQTKNELTPLFAAIKKGNIKVVQSLLNHNGIDVNNKTIFKKSEQTPLYTAIDNNDLEIARLLIERGDIDVNLKSREFEIDYDEITKEFHREVTPLYKAIECNNVEICKLLLQHKSIDINAIINVTLYEYEDPEEEKSDPTYFEKTALFEAVSSNNAKIVELLVSQDNIDVNIASKAKSCNEILSETTALQKAVQNRNSEITKILLKSKTIDVNTKMIDPTNSNDWNDDDIKSNKASVKKEFEEIRSGGNGVTHHITEETILYCAVENDDTEIVSLLLEHENIDVNCKSLNKKYSYFIESSEEGRKEREEKRLEEFTPLYLAVMNKNNEIVKLLVEHKSIDINMKSTFYLDKCEKLINSDEKTIEEKPTFVDKEETALHNAVENGNIDIIKTLLKHPNIDINCTNKQNKKPIELTNNEEITSLLNFK